MTITRLDIAGFTTCIVGPDDASTTVVLLHGFGAPGDDLVPFGTYLRAPARYVFPAAPIELGGLYGDSRAWWRLDLERLEEDLRLGRERDRRAEVPAELPGVRARVLELLDALQAKFSIPDDRLVLGGFSQGAMVSLDVALHRKVAPAGLALMSGTLLAEAEWTPRMATLAGVPVVQSHGRHDQLLPYAIAEVLRDKLVAAGAKVDWQPFGGGHEIPPPVLAAVARLITSVGDQSK